MDDKDTQIKSFKKLVHVMGDLIGKAETRLPTCKYCGI